MACNSCGNLPPVQIVRSVGATKLSVKRIRPLHPRRRQNTNIIPKPANADRYRI